MWREGLPTGNGVMGASVLGGAGFDTVTINHNDLWWHGKTGVLPDVSDKLRATKTAINNENYIDAQNVLVNALIAKSYRPQPSYPLPVCDLKIKMDIEKKVTDYSRALNMENGEVSVSFRDKNTRFDVPTQVLFVDSDGVWCAGIAYDDYVICGCCGGIFDIGDVVDMAAEAGIKHPIYAYADWNDIAAEITGGELPEGLERNDDYEIYETEADDYEQHSFLLEEEQKP